MVEWHGNSKRKISGGINTGNNARDKRLFEKGGLFSSTKVVVDGNEKRKSIRTRGNNLKVKAQSSKFVVVSDSKGKVVKGEVITVLDNTANRDYTRTNILTKGAKIKVKIGNEEKIAIVSSRPGQSGTIQCVFAE